MGGQHDHRSETTERNDMNEQPKKRIVIFFREAGFYPLELPRSDDIGAHAKANPGTLRVEDVDGNVLWALTPPTPDGRP